MTQNLHELIERYTVRHDRKIKKICAPLQEHFDIPTFVYYTVDEKGGFVVLSNFPEHLVDFYGNNLHLSCPYLTHPSLFRSGYSIGPVASDPEYLEYSRERFGLQYLFLILRQKVSSIEGFLFATKNLTEASSARFLTNIDSLEKFGSYFKREAQSLIKSAAKDNYNLHRAKGAAFLSRDPGLPLSKKDSKRMNFLKDITSLSPQEERCLELFKQGNSAQATGALLGISQRTVEHYIDNIKDKLQCYSKHELLQW